MKKQAILFTICVVCFAAIIFLVSQGDPSPTGGDASNSPTSAPTAPNVENSEEGPLPKLWQANCNEYITLRKTPGGYGIDTIPVGGVMELEVWDGMYAKVKYGKHTGYVLTSYIKPAGDNYFSNMLRVVDVTPKYTYSQMVEDIHTLREMYPDLITVDSIGTSELGRDIPVMRIGNPEAPRRILIQGSIHAREHMNTWLLMAIWEYQLAHDPSFLNEVCFHVIPMANPDGVTLSQTASFTETQLKIYNDDLGLHNTRDGKTEYAAVWKANGLGIDLNRNFPAGWEKIPTRDMPSSEEFKGTEPLCAAESRTLAEYTLKYTWTAVISYHSSGSIIYHKYGQREDVNRRSASLAQAVEMVTGYPLSDGQEMEGGGYRDWAIDTLGIPSITVEVGCGEPPLQDRELYCLFARNYDVMRALANWAAAQPVEE